MLRSILPSLVLIAAAPAVAADSAAWPTLAQQLAEAKAPPGSALAQLIEAHQDFAKLRPAEAHDKIGIPPWLRLLWREQHPSRPSDAHDPTGGYPRRLKDTFRWMRSHPDLQRGEPEQDEPSSKAAAPPPSASIGSNRLISGQQTTPRSEASVQIDYNDPQRLVAGANAISLDGRQAMFYSSDGGESWGQTQLPYVGRDNFHSDPVVDWTSDGTAWATTLGQAGLAGRLRAYRSSDGGASWQIDGTPSGNQTDTDKEMMWVDHSENSPYRDTLYVTWHKGPAYIARRTAKGWQTPLRLSGSETSGTAIGGDVKTNSAGEVFAFWPSTGNSSLFLAKSGNGGASFAKPLRLAKTYGSYDIGVPSFAVRRALIYVTAAAYKASNLDMVYAAWTDLSGESLCTTPRDEPDINSASTCKTRIWFSRSSDGGAHWSAPLRLNHQSSKNDQYNPWMAVDETSGTLSIVYYDTVADAKRLKTDLWYQFSTDQGATWSAAKKVTTAMTDETAPSADSSNQYGDYNGLAVYNGVAFPVWTDRRNNTREQIWTARIVTP
jgi:hypothetical protein